VQGLVTVSLKNVPFETALQNILKQVKATYRREGGIYQIINREEEVQKPADDIIADPAPKNNVRRKVHVNHGDPLFLATILSKSSTDFALSPEISTVLKTPSNGRGNGGFGNNNFGGGSNGNNGLGNGFGNNMGGNGSNGSPGRGPGNGNRSGGGGNGFGG
jgi:hypothetical protein